MAEYTLGKLHSTHKGILSDGKYVIGQEHLAEKVTN